MIEIDKKYIEIQIDILEINVNFQEYSINCKLLVSSLTLSFVIENVELNQGFIKFPSCFSTSYKEKIEEYIIEYISQNEWLRSLIEKINKELND